MSGSNVPCGVATLVQSAGRKTARAAIRTVLLALAWVGFGILAGAGQAQAQNVDWVVNVSDAGHDPTPANGTVVYALTVDNNGFDPAGATTLSVQIPANTVFTAASGTITGCAPMPATGPATVTCNVPPLASAASANVAFSVRALVAGGITLAASVPVTGDVDASNNSVSEPTTITSGADIALSVTGPATAASGSLVTYTHTITNNGPDPVTSVQLQFPVPTGLANVTPPAGCTLSGGTYTCTITGPIAVGATVTRDFTGQVVAASGSTVTVASSTLNTAPTDAVSTNNSATVSTTITGGSDLRITKSRSPAGTLLVGGTANFTLTPTYSGDSPTGITVHDTVPGNYTITGVTAPGWSCSVTGQDVNCARATGAGAGANMALGPITIATTVAAPGTPTNTATIAATGPADPNPGNNSATDGGATIAAPTIDLRANKSGPNPALAVVGNSYGFNISTSNVGNAAFYGTIEMRDTLPAGLQVTGFALNGWTCSPAAPVTGPATILCTRVYTAGAPLAAGATTPAVGMTTTVTAPGSLVNGLLVGSPDGNLPDTNAPNDSTSYGVTSSDPAGSADIAVRKTATLASLPSGDIQTFAIEVTNTGPTASTNVTLTDNLLNLINSSVGATGAGFIDAVVTPGAASGASCSTTAAGANGRQLTCSIATLPVCTTGADCPVVTVRVRPGGDAGARTNTASVISNTTADPALGNNSAVANYSVEARADVTVTKTASPSPVAAGQNLTYVITARNLANGLSAAGAVTITDTLPMNVTYVSASPSSGSCGTAPAAGSTTAPGNNSLVCNLGTIANGSQQTVTVVVRPNLATRATTLQNDVSVATSTTETDTTNNSATVLTPVQPPVVDLLINKDDTVDPVPVGNTTEYLLIVTNLGPSAAENVVVTDTMPANRISYQSHVVPADGTCATVPAVGSLGGTLQCSFPVLAAGETRTIRVTGLGVAKGVTTNNATVASDETALGFEPNTANNDANETTTVRTRADVEVASKVATPATVNLRDPFSYLVTIRNNAGAGLSEADEVVVTDTLPAGMELTGTPTLSVVSGTASTTTCTGAAAATSFNCSLGTLSSGGVVEITVPVRVTAVTANPQTLTNTASVATSSFDTVPANNSNSGPVTVNASSIAGSVFRDFANDGGLTAGDSGIAGLTVTLTGTAADGTAINRTTTTAANGAFSFGLLPQGSYSVSHAAISETYLSNGTTAAGTAGGSAAPTVISAITLPAATNATGYLFPKIPQARVAIAKALQSGPVMNPDGTFTAGFRLVVRNPSLEALSQVRVSDALQGAAPLFGNHVGGTPTALGTYTVSTAPNGSCGGTNAGFNGAGDPVVAQGFTLAAGASCTIDIGVTVMPTNPLPPIVTGTARYLNQANVTAEGALSGQTSATNPQLADLSDDGANTDANGNGQGNEPGENDPTPVGLTLTSGISLIKSIASVTDTTGDGQIGTGDTVAYVFAVRNTGNTALAGVTVTDPLITVAGGPVSLAIGATDSTSFSGSYVLTQADLDRGHVQNSATANGNAVTATGVPILDDTGNPVTVSDVSDAGTAPNGSTVASPETTETPDGTGATDGDPANDPTVATLTALPRIQLIKSLVSITDTTGDGLIGAGDTVAYSFAVTNTGNLHLANVTVTDPLVTVAGGPISLAPGTTDSTTFTASYTLVQADVNRGHVLNSATVTGGAVTAGGTPILGPGGAQLTASDVSDTGTAPDGSTVANPSGTETPDATGGTDGDPTNDPTVALISQTAGIELIKSLTGTTDVNGNGYLDVGDTLDYGFTVTNTGNLALANVTVTDPIVAVAGGPVSLAIGATDSTSFTATYTLVQADVDRGYVENTATTTGDAVDDLGNPILDGTGNPVTVTDVSDTGTARDGTAVTNPAGTETPDGAGGTDGDPTNDPTVTEVGRPQIGLDIQIAGIPDVNGNGIIDAGDQVLYTFTVTNLGTVPLNNVNMDLTTLTLPLPGLSCAPITLAVGATQTLVCTGNGYTITPADVGVGTVTLGGTATGTSAAGVVVTAADSVISPAFGLGGLTIAKTVDRGQVNPGEVVRYTITVTNSSTTQTTVTNVVDVLPGGFIYQQGTAAVNGTATEPVASGRRLVWQGVSLAPGASAAITLDVLVSASVRPGNHDNTARALSPLTGAPVTLDAIATVRVAAEPVFACATVIGRVFDDLNQDGYYNGEPKVDRMAITDQTYHGGKWGAPEEPDREKGLPGVRLVAPNGLSVTTDPHGRYSIPCAALPHDIGSNFMLKLDTRTLPSGYRLTTENPRVVRVTPGMLTKMNFGATISRVVRVDLSARAFGTGDAALTPRPELVEGLRRMVGEVADTPVMLRLAYQPAAGEDDRAAKRRLKAVEKVLRGLWPANGRYQLNVEAVVERRATGSGTK